MGRRVGAYLIDAFVGLVLSVILFFVLADRLDVPLSLDGDDACDLLEATDEVAFCFNSDSTLFYLDDGQAALVFLVPVGYWFLLNGIIQGLTGATIGKALLGLRVVDENGAVCGVGKALLRTVVGLVDSLPTLMALGFVIAVNRTDKRRLGDMAASTNVVRSFDVGRPPDQAVAPAAGTWTPPPPGHQSPALTDSGAPAPPGTAASPGGAFPSVPPQTPPGPPPIPPGAQDGPVWDPNRGKYVQIQPGSGVLVVFDDDTQTWRRADES